MAKSMNPELAGRLREESEATRESPYPRHTTVSRPNRTKVYSVRLSADEQAEVEAAAEARHLPASTLVRSWILDRLEREKSA